MDKKYEIRRLYRFIGKLEWDTKWNIMKKLIVKSRTLHKKVLFIKR